MGCEPTNSRKMPKSSEGPHQKYKVDLNQGAVDVTSRVSWPSTWVTPWRFPGDVCATAKVLTDSAMLTRAH